MPISKIFLLDVLPLLYRSHFAMININLMNAKGLNTAPILGFCNSLFQIIFQESPTHIAAVLDGKSIKRISEYNNYKSNREKVPEVIQASLPYVREILNALNIKLIEKPGYEADDLIGTIARKAERNKFEVFIVSPDKDYAQLVSDHIYWYRPSYKGVNFEILNAEKVKNKFGVFPQQITDYLGLMGDPVDNIPGIPRIGEKTASALLQKFGSLENVLANKEKIEKKSIRESLFLHAEKGILSKTLATINATIDIHFNEQDYRLKEPDPDQLLKILDELEFEKLKGRIFKSRFYGKFFRDLKRNPVPKEGVSGDHKLLKEYKFELVALKNIEEIPKVINNILQRNFFAFRTIGDLTGKDKNCNLFFSTGNKIIYFLDGDWENKEKIFKIIISKVFEDQEIQKVGYELKEMIKILKQTGVAVKGKLFDIKIADYLINPEGNHDLNKIKDRYVDHSKVILEGDEKIIEKIKDHTPIVQNLGIMRDLKEKLQDKLKEDKLESLFYSIEIPLIEVLAEMEINGIKIDLQTLDNLSEMIRQEMNEVQQKIFSIAGYEFNLNSSREVGVLLSKYIKPGSEKKTKTGLFSTAESTLLNLAGEHKIAGLLLEYRQLSKLYSAYITSLPQHVDEKTKRIHAVFNQAVTATGRLSCSRPNLQQLPILGERGREIRKMVIPENDQFLILTADYSHVELRLLANLSGDTILTSIFRNDMDIHTITASKVFKVPESGVTREMRAKAKMVNFGIIYGITPFGLSQRLKIKTAEAKAMIETYFQEFPMVKKYIEDTIHFARIHGYSQSITGRRRYLPGINSKNGVVRKAAERIAINAPLQGLAADLIKKAMIEIHQYMKEEKLKSKMILQVHDELVFEVYKKEQQELTDIVKDKMENGMGFTLPMSVNIKAGENWLENNKELVIPEFMEI